MVLGGTLLDNAQLFDQVSTLASSDPLTGLANHRRLFETLESELQRSRRTGRSFAVLLFDLDGLKKINDKYGHLTGSRAIKRLGSGSAEQQPRDRYCRAATEATNSRWFFRNLARRKPSRPPSAFASSSPTTVRSRQSLSALASLFIRPMEPQLRSSWGPQTAPSIA